MANMSSYLEEEILDHILRGNSYTSPGTVYIGLVTSTATDADLEGGDLTNEITGYTGDRKSVTFTIPSQVSGKGTVENDIQIDFEDMPNVTVEYAIICDSLTPGGGNILYWAPANSTKTTNSGDTYRIDISNLVIDQD